MKREKIVGIYCIENLINHKKYVGQAQDICDRWSDHRKELRGNYSKCSALQNAWNKYGEENFKFWIVFECEINLLDEAETFYMQNLCTHVSRWGYNVFWGGRHGMRGIKQSEESNEKRSKSEIGDKNHFFGKKHTDEAKKLISKARAGVPNNQAGTKKRNVKSSSKHIGAYLNKGKAKWESYIHTIDGQLYLGTFLTELEAAMAYNEAALFFYGWKAKLNVITPEQIE
jgi:group I intron endonuclease